MGIISWIIVGALAGWIGSKITGNDANMGAGLTFFAVLSELQSVAG